MNTGIPDCSGIARPLLWHGLLRLGLLRWGLLLWGLLLCGHAIAPANVKAQSIEPENRYTFLLLHVPLHDALDAFINKTEADIFYESDLIAGKTAYCNITGATAREALQCILKETRLDFYQQSSGLYVIVEGPEEAPKYSSITGLVLDGETNEPLPYASVFLEEAETGTASNFEGRFAFSQLNPGKYRVYATHVAYQEQVDSLELAPDTHHQVSLRLSPRIVLSTPIVINGLQERLPSELRNANRVDAGALQNAPAVVTPSTLQSLDRVVGVHIGDALSDVHVQGGDAGEHQFLLDGAPIYVPIRNGGFFGSFSPFAIEQINIHKAGFGARHGSFLAGSIAMTHDLKRTDGTAATFQIDPLSVNGRINGVLRENKPVSAQWMVAGRLGLWDLFQPNPLEENFRAWSQPNTFLDASLSGQPQTDPASLADSLLTVFFSDIHAATRIRFGNARSLYASLYSGHNDFGIGTVPAPVPLQAKRDDDDEDEEDDAPAESYAWSNRMSQIRYEWVQGKRAFVKVGIWNSRYRLRHPFTTSPFLPSSIPASDALSDDFNEVKSMGLFASIDWAPAARHVISAELQYVDTHTEFQLSIDPTSDSLSITEQTVAPIRGRLQSFIEDVISLSPQATLTLGSRLTYVPSQQRLYAEPRIAIRRDFQRAGEQLLAIQLAAGLYRQFTNQFDIASYNSAALLPSFRFWIPVSKSVRASSAYHIASSLLFVASNQLQFNLEAYYKYHPYLTVLNYTARFAPDEAALFEQARGYAYGFAASSSYRSDAFHFSIAYEYALSRRQQANRFENRYVPVPWEAPHQLNASLDISPIPYVTATVRWIGLWGRSWGYRQAYYDYLEPDNSIPLPGNLQLSSPEAHTLPAFTQLDLGLAYSRRIGKLGIQSRINFINAGNRKNTIDWMLTRDADQNVTRIPRLATAFFPSLSLKITY